MILLISNKVSELDLQNASQDIPGYIKFVVDLENKSLRIGGVRHFDSEQLFLEEGSKQSELWGGGIELDSGEIDYGSMINIRPPINNSKDVKSDELIKKINEILKIKFSDINSIKFNE